MHHAIASSLAISKDVLDLLHSILLDPTDLFSHHSRALSLSKTGLWPLDLSWDLLLDLSLLYFLPTTGQHVIIPSPATHRALSWTFLPFLSRTQFAAAYSYVLQHDKTFLPTAAKTVQRSQYLAPYLTMNVQIARETSNSYLLRGSDTASPFIVLETAIGSLIKMADIEGLPVDG